MNLKGISLEDMKWINAAQDREQWLAPVNPFGSINGGKFGD
jgi:hypothetical protein